MFVPILTPLDPLGWYWYVPATIIALIIAIPLFSMKPNFTRRHILIATVWAVTWSFVALGLRVLLVHMIAND